MTTKSERNRQLQELYDQVPKMVDCTGECWTSCGPIQRSVREDQRIRERGIRISHFDEVRGNVEAFWCEALTEDKRCAVYDIRPFICRLWGTTENLRCPAGCVPERWLTDREGLELYVASLRIGGSNEIPPTMDDEQVISYLFDKIAETTQMFFSRGLIGDRQRMEEHTIPAAFRRR